MRVRFRSGVLPLLLALAACDGAVDDRLLGIRATGSVLGITFIDRDGDSLLGPPPDSPAPGVDVALLRRGTADTVARARSDALGTFRMPDVPVGEYTLVADRGALGDSLRVLAVHEPDLTIAAGDTVARIIVTGFDTASTATLRASTPGRRLFIEGIALTGWSTFGDSTVHILDRAGALRAVRVRPAPIQPGDSVRLLGGVASLDGQPVLSDAIPTILSVGARNAPPEDVSTGLAATADGGRLDAALVRISGALVLDTAWIAGELQLGVDDGSGRLEVLLDRHTPFSPGAYAPGALLDATGVLVPISAAGWRLKPRSAAELAAAYPTATVAQARQLPAGRTVFLRGIALSAWNQFGDASLHILDATGALRAIRVHATQVQPGDSVRLLGTLAIHDGQPNLTDATVTLLLPGARTAAPVDVASGTAAAADGARLDAALVRVRNAVVRDTATQAGDRRLGVDDGTGRLEVVLHRSINFGSGRFLPDDTLDVTGLLVPIPGRAGWQLMPRSLTDLVVR